MNVGTFAVIKKSYKKFVLVKVLISLSDLFKGYTVFDVGINSCENATVYGEKVRNKGNNNLSPESFERVCSISGVWRWLATL